MASVYCKGITLTGKKCKRKVSNGEYCYQHSPPGNGPQVGISQKKKSPQIVKKKEVTKKTSSSRSSGEKKSGSTKKIHPFLYDMKGKRGHVPPDGKLRVYYYENFLSDKEASSLMAELLDLEYKNSVTFMMGKLMAGSNYYRWYADTSTWLYKFSGAHQTPLEVHKWTPTLLKIRDRAYEFVKKKDEELNGPNSARWDEGRKPNAVLINYYPDARAGLSYHGDAHKWYGDDFDVISISLGAERDIRFRQRSDKVEVMRISQKSGSLVLMMGQSTQTDYEHGIPPMPSSAPAKGPRINLTFRTIYPDLVQKYPLSLPKTESAKIRAREAKKIQSSVIPSKD